ncbi:Dephospho-CoA kinase [bacterium HR33]|nr:Dephospho-CoA kinase [bacterium HR33]
MLNVALTGNIASGKSTVLGWFSQWGATVIDADRLVRESQRPGSPVWEEIRKRFGDAVILPDGELDRAALRRLIFRDDRAREDLNAIVHPAVRERRRALAAEAEARGDLVLVSDIPLLFETGDPAAFDLIVLVDAPAELRKQRLVSLRGIDPQEADRMLAAQLPSEAKRPRSHVVLDNGGSLDQLRGAAWEAWREIRKRAARKALGGFGKLLVVTSSLGDTACHFAGTLARYRDAGIEICLARVPPESEPGAAASEFFRELGIEREIPISSPDSLRQLLENFNPAVVLGFDPSSTDRRRAAAGRTAREAWYAAGRPGRLFYALEERGKEAAARLDVRPWRDLKSRVLEASRDPECAGRGSGENSGAWECYLAEGELYGELKDLFGGP